MMNNLKVIEEIEMLSKQKRCDYIDAVVLFCEQRKIEVEVIADIVRNEPAMKMKLFANAQDLNLVKGRGAKLPI